MISINVLIWNESYASCQLAHFFSEQIPGTENCITKVTGLIISVCYKLLNVAFVCSLQNVW